MNRAYADQASELRASKLVLLLGTACTLATCTPSKRSEESSAPRYTHAQALVFVKDAAIFYEEGAYDPALELYQKAAPVLALAPGENADSLSTVYFRIGDSLSRLRRSGEAIEAFRKTVSIAENHLPSNSIELIKGLVSLGRLQLESGKGDRGVAELSRAHGMLSERKLDEEEPIQFYLTSTESLADANRALDRTEAAVEHAVEHAEACQKYLGANQERTGLAQAKAAEWLRESGRVGLARQYWRSSIRSLTSSLGKDHVAVADLLVELARLDFDIFLDAEAAGAGFSEALRIYRQQGNKGEKLFAALDGAGIVSFHDGTAPAQRPIFEEAAKLARRLFGADSPQAYEATARFAACLAFLGEDAKARALLDPLTASREEDEKFKSTEYLEAFDFAALALDAVGEAEAAESLLAANFRQSQADLGGDHPRFVHAALRVVRFYLEHGITGEANRFLDHLQKKSVADYGESHPRTAYFAYLLGRSNYAASKFEDAEKYFQTALEVFTKEKGPSSSLALATRHHLGIVLTSLARYDEATAAFKENLKLQRETLGETHEKCLITEACLARILLEEGQYEQARKQCVEALNRPGDTLNADILGLAELQDCLSRTMYLLEDGENCARHAEEALRVRLKHLHPRHDDVVRSRTLLGAAYTLANKTGQAELQLRQARDITTQVHGQRSLAMMNIARRYAILFDRTGHLEDAGNNFRAALKIAEGIYPEAHPAIIRSYKELALWLMKRARYGESADQLRLALELAEKRYGSDSIRAAEFKSDLAAIIAKGGDPEEGLRMVEEVGAILTQNQDTADPGKVFDVRFANVHVYLSTGDLEASEGEIQKTLDLAEKHPDLHARLINGMTNLGLALDAKREYAQAEKIARESVRLAEKFFPKANDSAIRAYQRLGIALFRLERFEDAEEYLSKALEAARVFHGEGSASLLDHRRFLASCHGRLGNEIEAEKELIQCSLLAKELYGEDTELFDSLRHELGVLHANAGRPREALQLFENSLVFRKKYFGPGFDTINAISQIAQIYADLAEYPKAVNHTLDAIAMLNELGEDDSAAVADFYYSLGSLYFRMANRTRTLEYWEQALNRYRHLKISNDTVKNLEENVKILRAEHTR